MSKDKMFQVSTLQALALGYTRAVIPVSEFVRHGNTGLGTFEGVNGEMIVIDGRCYQANMHGQVSAADPDTGVSFAVIAECGDEKKIQLAPCASIDDLKEQLDHVVDDAFELNSMHVVRVDGLFESVSARSESGSSTNHVELKDILAGRQFDFVFTRTKGSLVALRFPDYMDGINAVGWHFHYISNDRTQGGHVFNLSFEKADAYVKTISQIELRLPTGPVFDTYDLKRASKDDT